MIPAERRKEAWRVLEGESAVLDTARDVSHIFREAEIAAAVVGDVAVGLHGHVRATSDVDVFVPEPLDVAGAALRQAGYQFDAKAREFSKGVVPVQLVTIEQTGRAPRRRSVIDHIVTVSLADLINMKLYSGTRSIARMQDLADVIGLIRVAKLNSAFAARIDKPLRPEFRKLLQAAR